MQKIIINIALLVFAFVSIQAQDVSITATAPETVQVGEQFRIVYEINDRVRDFTPPDFNDFVFLSSQQGMSTINWKTTQQFVYLFRASQAGTFNIGAAKAKHKSGVITSNTLEIEVISGSGSKSSSSSSSTSQKPKNSSPSVNSSKGEDLFVRLILSKNTCYVGEQITGFIKVYTKSNLSGINPLQGPEFTGFYVQNVKVPPLRSLEPEKLGNETYYTGLISKVNLTPQKTGKVYIEPFEVVVQKQKRVRVGYFTTYQDVDIPLTSKQVLVNVKPLPVNRPAGFAGAIGDFNVKATISNNTVKTNDAVVFKVNVSGKGNIKLIDNINYKLPPTFDAFDPVVKTSLSESGLSGSKIFEITVIPRHAGEFEIKPFELVYFNPKTGSFATKKTETFNVNVEKSIGDSTRVVVSNLSREDVELLESDIRYIKTETKLQEASSYYIETIAYYAAIVFSALVFLILIYLRREQIKRNANMARTKHKRASKMANKRLKLAKKFVKENENEAFYDELSKALWGYISDKLNITQSELSADIARIKLLEKDIAQEIVDGFLNLIEACEFARYAPGQKSNQPTEMLTEANGLISKVEQKI